jgi:hypothetical protein
MVLISVQDLCTVWAERTKGLEIILGAPINLLGNVGEVEACFSLFGDSFNLGAREVHDLHRVYHGHGNPFGHTRGTS